MNGWSLGGCLATRAASGEHRLAACIADSGLADVAESFRPSAIKLGIEPQAATRLGELDQAVFDQVKVIVAKDRVLNRSINQRGFWMNGVDSQRDYLRSVDTFTMAERIEDIRCPTTLFTLDEGDPLGTGTQAFFDSLHCPRRLIGFTAAEGAERTLRNAQSLVGQPRLPGLA